MVPTDPPEWAQTEAGDLRRAPVDEDTAARRGAVMLLAGVIIVVALWSVALIVVYRAMTER